VPRNSMEWQTVHARRRAMQRHGVKLNRNRLGEIVAQIRKTRAAFLARLSRRITVWRVESDGREMVAFYDSVRHTVATLLTVGQWERRPGP
jgi:hypothetical protein